MNTKHPIQPLELDENGILRFKANNIVRHLLDHGGIDLNQIATLDVSREEHEQFAQLIGYSLSGFGELSYVSDETYLTAEKMHTDKISELEAKNAVLTEQLEQIKAGLKIAASAAFDVHPDDLN